MKRTDLKRTPFKKKSRTTTQTKAKKKRDRSATSAIIERQGRPVRGSFDKAAVVLRDLGFCAICRLNTFGYQRWLDSLPLWDGRRAPETVIEDKHTASTPTGKILGRHRARARVLLGRLWGVVLPIGCSLSEIDHIVPVAEGGGGCGLDNLRTLCRKCHTRESAALNRRLRKRPTKGVGRGF